MKEVFLVQFWQCLPLRLPPKITGNWLESGKSADSQLQICDSARLKLPPTSHNLLANTIVVISKIRWANKHIDGLCILQLISSAAFYCRAILLPPSPLGKLSTPRLLPQQGLKTLGSASCPLYCNAGFSVVDCPLKMLQLKTQFQGNLLVVNAHY